MQLNQKMRMNAAALLTVIEKSLPAQIKGKSAASNEFLVSGKNKMHLAAGANANNAETSPFN